MRHAAWAERRVLRDVGGAARSLGSRSACSRRKRVNCRLSRVERNAPARSPAATPTANAISTTKDERRLPARTSVERERDRVGVLQRQEQQREEDDGADDPASDDSWQRSDAICRRRSRKGGTYRD